MLIRVTKTPMSTSVAPTVNTVHDSNNLVPSVVGAFFRADNSVWSITIKHTGYTDTFERI